MKQLLLIGLVFSFSYRGLGQSAIDSTGTLSIGGIKQFVSIKGKDNRDPLLLFLHGGPGNSVIHYAEKFTHKLQEHFIVVQWDQRNAGKTLTLNNSQGPVTIELFERDTHEIIDTLLRRFHQPKLYLVGHSWGTFLGFYMAKSYPELLYAYLPICPMVNQLESERLILALMKEKASKTANEKALQELALVKVPFENGRQLYFHRKWVLDYMGSKAKINEKQVQEWATMWLPLFNEASKDNLFESAPALRCPVYFFVGRKDVQTNAGITERYYNILDSPKKQLYWFERSGHSLPTSEPDLLQEIIIGIKNK
jgi:pimeloyl-ACP methyl ester carboxylesterase